MIATADIEQMIGAEVVDPNHHKVGKVTHVYVDSETEQPTWASVRTGIFGVVETLVPLTEATWDHENVHIDVDKSRVKDAPRVDPEAEISSEAQGDLYAYYGMRSGTAVPSDELGPSGSHG